VESRVIGRVQVGGSDLATELTTIQRYSEYYSYVECFGDWRSFTLANSTGCEADYIFREGQGGAKLTELGKRVPHLIELIAGIFDFSRVVQVRAFSLSDGVVFPHRDYIEVNNAYVRLQVPLVTNPLAFHAEMDSVFQMQQGEVWYLAAERLHTACNLIETPRLNLCIDLVADDLAELGLEGFAPMSVPATVARLPLTSTVRSDLLGLARATNRYNVKDVIKVVLKAHFLYEMSLQETIDLLLELGETCPDPAVDDRIREIERYMIGERDVGTMLTPWAEWLCRWHEGVHSARTG